MGWDELNKSVGATTATSGGWGALNKAAMTPSTPTKSLLASSAPVDFSKLKVTGQVFPTGTPKPANTGFNYGNATNLMSIGGTITKAGAESGAKQVYQGVNQTVGGVKDYNLLKIGEGALNTLAGAINAVSAPLNATVFAPLSPAVDYAANKLADTNALKEFGAGSIDTPANEQTTTEREVQAILNAFTIAGTFAGGLKFGEKAPVETPRTLPVSSEGATTNIPIRTPSEYEPYTPTDELPVIQMGAKEPSSLPTIQAQAPKAPELPGYKVEPIKTAAEAPKTRTTSTIKPVEGTGQVKTRGLSQNVEATAIEKKLTDNFGDLPEYKQVSMKEQAAQAADFMTKDAEGARAVAMGQKAAPKGLLPESVFVATEQKAIAEGDVQTLRDLANSKLAGAATTMGQRIRTLGERDSASPLHAIQEVQRAREAALAKRGETTATTVERVRSAIRKTNTKESWGEFVNSITC